MSQDFQPEYDLSIAGEEIRYSKGEGATPAGLYRRTSPDVSWERFGDLPPDDVRSRTSIQIEAGLLELAFRSGWRPTHVQREHARETTTISLKHGDDGLVLEVDQRGRLSGPQTYIPADAAAAWVGTVAEVSQILTDRTTPATAARDIDSLHRRFPTADRHTAEGPLTLVHGYVSAKGRILQCRFEWTGALDPMARSIDWKLVFTGEVSVEVGHTLGDAGRGSTYYRRTDTGQEFSSGQLAVRHHAQSLSFLVPNPAQIREGTPFRAILNADDYQTSTVGNWIRGDA